VESQADRLDQLMTRFDCRARNDWTVTEQIHDDEPDTSEAVVRTLLAAECPLWTRYPIEYLRTSGTDNAMWRVRLDGDSDIVVRLPRRPSAADGVLQEMAVLQGIEHARISTVVATPSVRHIGQPHDVFPHHWSVLDWIDGSDAWTVRDELSNGASPSLIGDLAQAVTAIGEIVDIAVRSRPAGNRGGPLGPLLERLHGWLDEPQWNAAGLIDVGVVRRLAAEAADVIDEPVSEGFVHGDLIPGNLLVDRGRLTAIIDWGGAGWGDTAQDLAPAWAVLEASERAAFRRTIGVEESTWIRGRTFELEHAVGGVLYYVPRRHPLGDVMARTLTRIIENP
jgi:aminoglycoside phosphotransferase (APT) family kinase protein